MGAGRSGNFGNTKGSQDGATALDYISNGLALASLIPGVDTVTDILSIPVDIARKDWLSVGFDLVGIIPWVGEPSDAAKLARITDKVSDTSRIASRSDKGTKLLNKATNQKLKNTIKEMYRPGAKIGDGGLSDAIRHEIKTGNLVGGKSHIQKGKERIRNLENIIRMQELNPSDSKMAKELVEDLKKAMEGK